jgi:DNA-binding CsgD family transcriptional regulator
MTTTVHDPLAAGHAALAEGSWAEAQRHFEAAVAHSATGSAWEGLSWATWWLGDEATTFAAREAAFRSYRAAREPIRAAWMAIWLASDSFDFRGDDAVAAGWLERARRLLDGSEQTPEYGWLLLLEANLVMRAKAAPAEAVAFADRAVELGRELGIVDLEAVGLGVGGVALVGAGRVEEGMRRVDEASALAAAEEFKLPLSPAWTLCCVVSACEDVGDFPRAAQWCGSMRAFAERWDARNVMGMCRSAYGNLLAAAGDWPAADAELSSAVADLGATRPAMAAGGLARLGALRARQGRVAEARALFERAVPHPLALVGLGGLALEDGDVDGAADAADRVLRRLTDAAPLPRVPALELLVRAEARRGDFEVAAHAASELASTTASVGTPYLIGRAHLTIAELAAARGRHETAREAAEDALDSLTESAAPFEAAQARLVLCGALLELGRPDGAAGHARSARATLGALGAEAEVARADRFIERCAGGRGAAGEDAFGELTARELEVLRLVAGGLSDAEIAERLVVSPHTVHRHVANVRNKLRLPSRAAAVAHAARAGLI